jgi:hypothetical protein
VIRDFYTWLLTLDPVLQVGAALVVIAAVAAFVVFFQRGRDEPRGVRWVVAVCAGLIASLIVLVAINLLRLVWL